MPSNQEEKMQISKLKKSYEFDDLLAMVGGFGRYNFLLYSFLCVMTVPIGLQQLVQVFYGATPKYSCVSFSHTLGNNTCTVLKAGTCCEKCTEYNFSGRLTSAVTEWDLVCDRKHLKAMTQTVFMGGLLVGSVAFSALSDHVGRKIVAFLSIFFLGAGATVSAVADCLSLFTLFRFVAGAGTAGCLLSRFVYCMEITQINNRTAAGMVNNIFVSVGFVVLSLLAYLIRDWRYLMLTVSLPGLPLLLCWWIIPESPRWLIAKNRLDEAHELLMKYARKNRVNVDSEHLHHAIQEFKKEEDKNRDQFRKTYGILDMFRTPKLRKRTVICGFNWFANGLVYFGISLNVGNLAGDMYLNFFFLSIVEIPGALLLWFLLKRYGRRIPYASFMIFGGLAGTLVSAVPSSEGGKSQLCPNTSKVNNLSFFFLHLSYSLTYPALTGSVSFFIQGRLIHLAIIRNCFSFKADLPNLSKTLPLVIFGIFGILAGILALWLPETLHSPLAQTVEQVEAWDEDYKIYCCRRHRSAKEEIIMEMSDNEEANQSLVLT
ncbi:unnamed protein product [Porites evermanni]|uniref:Major facilitator superfamily (MFS) profile domain-containing protein n=1 Tax=Porites evermanni TaxID=104178 RepID=A0ABN8MDT0_9CNID|nr:unnamed protein product [Porites evermanni]